MAIMPARFGTQDGLETRSSGWLQRVRGIPSQALAACLLPALCMAQSGTITLHRIEVTWSGRTHIFDSATNTLDVEPSVSFANRFGSYRAVVSYQISSFPTIPGQGPQGVGLMCAPVVEGSDHTADTSGIAIAPNAPAASNISLPGRLWIEPPSRAQPERQIQYRFACRLMTADIVSGERAFATSREIVVRQNWLVRQSLTVVGAVPDPAVSLAVGSVQTFRVTADWEENSIPFGFQLRLSALDAENRELGAAIALRPELMATNGTREVVLQNVRLPSSRGPVRLRLQMKEVLRFENQDIDRVWLTAPEIRYNIGPPPNPYQPGVPTDTRFVATEGDGLKTVCGSPPRPVTIPMWVSRAAALVDDNGRLFDAGTAYLTGVLTRWARLRLAVLNGGDRNSQVRHQVILNGETVDYRDAATVRTVPGGGYSLLVVDFPIRAVRFARRAQPGDTPVPATNEIRVLTGPDGSQCTEVDWVELSFGALAPVIMVHGNGEGDDGQGGLFWHGRLLAEIGQPRVAMRSGVVDAFTDVLYDTSISMPTGSISGHAFQLARDIPRIAASFGVRHVHLLAHSKGGLDSRAFLVSGVPDNFGVLSLITLSTPHMGSAGPDYQIDSQEASLLFSDDPIRAFVGKNYPVNRGTRFLRVAEADRFNQANLQHLPSGFTVYGRRVPIVYRAISADMNKDGSHREGKPTLSYDETESILGQGSIPEFPWTLTLQNAYHITGYVQRTKTETVLVPNPLRLTLFDLLVHVKTVRETVSNQFHLNDIAVRRESATLYPFEEIAHVKANHATVASVESGRLVRDQLRLIQPMPPDPLDEAPLQRPCENQSHPIQTSPACTEREP
ncbi:MAG: hypothetical protein HY820_14770 [Acidobacteria bacterium]|nr:hypothetical protein [Acidobacteriota bacterium]